MAAEEFYRQSEFEFANTKPPANYTGFDLLGNVLTDVSSHNKDSANYDLSLLKKLASFEGMMKDEFQEIALGELQSAPAHTVVMDSVTVTTARQLSDETPRPRTVRVVGKLDMIRDSSQTFALHMDDGQEVRGVLLSGDMGVLAPLFRKRVLVQGKAIYRPSERLLRLDAEHVESGEGETEFWSHIPPPMDREPEPREIRRAQGQKGGVPAFIGTWPGDESDDEWTEMLKRLS